MKLARKYPLLGSSVDSDRVSLSLKALGPFLLLLAATLNLDISSGEIDNAVLATGATINGVIVLYGFGRKVYYFFKRRS